MGHYSSATGGFRQKLTPTPGEARDVPAAPNAHDTIVISDSYIHFFESLLATRTGDLRWMQGWQCKNRGADGGMGCCRNLDTNHLDATGLATILHCTRSP